MVQCDDGGDVCRTETGGAGECVGLSGLERWGSSEIRIRICRRPDGVRPAPRCPARLCFA